MRVAVREFVLLAVGVFLGILLYDQVVAKLHVDAVHMTPEVFRYVFLTLTVSLVVLLLRKL
ncbi:MAG TPA: hypothetical protein VIC59_07795 [Gemmatimonadota bacterium]|jgi:hypothetical protein